jgi:hypothetical protein
VSAATRSEPSYTPAPMERWERPAALAGVVAVVLWVVGTFVSGEAPDEAVELLGRFQDDEGRVLAGGFIFQLGALFFLIFVGALRLRLFTAEGPNGLLTAIAFGAGLAVGIFLLALPGGEMAAAINSDDLDPSSALALGNVGDLFFIGAQLSAALLLTATALLILRYGPMPRWFAWVSFALALVLLIPLIGWAALLVGVPLWTLAAAVLMWMRPSGDVGSGRGPSEPPAPTPQLPG